MIIAAAFCNVESSPRQTGRSSPISISISISISPEGNLFDVKRCLYGTLLIMTSHWNPVITATLSRKYSVPESELENNSQSQLIMRSRPGEM